MREIKSYGESILRKTESDLIPVDLLNLPRHVLNSTQLNAEQQRDCRLHLESASIVVQQTQLSQQYVDCAVNAESEELAERVDVLTLNM